MRRCAFKRFFSVCFAITAGIFLSHAYAQASDFAEGEELFRSNKSAQAIPYLEKAIANGEDPKAYIYLALCYQQEKEYGKALAICEKGMNSAGTNKKILAFDAGNIAFAMGDFSGAENWYSMAISADATYAAPVLNRANSKLKAGKYQESIADYENYLKLDPYTSQGNAIRAVIELLKNQMENEKKAEAIRVEQERKLKEEERRIAAERARQEAEEAARRKKLLEDVASSLQDSASENMSAGADGTVDYGYESELE